MNEKIALDICKKILENVGYFEFDTISNKILLYVVHGEILAKNITTEDLISSVNCQIDEDNLNIIHDFKRLMKNDYSNNQSSFKCSYDGITKWFLIEAFQRNENERIARGIVKSLSGIINNNEKLLELSKTDPLTGLLNRTSMEDYVSNLINENVYFNFLILDIDYFKNINDTFGHIIGDGVIRDIAHILKKIVGDEGEAGRLGGDEFTVIRKLDHEPSEEENRDLCRRIRSAIIDFAKVNSVMSYITVTIGLTSSPYDGKTYEELYSKADKALYKGKFKGRDCYVMYMDSLHKDINTDKKISDVNIENFKKKVSISEFIGCLFNSLLELKKKPEDKMIEIFNYFELNRITYITHSKDGFKVIKSFSNKIKETLDYIKINDYEGYSDLFEVDSAFLLNNVSDFKQRNKNKDVAIEIPYNYGSVVQIATGKQNPMDLIISFEVIGDRRIWMKEQINGMKVIARMLSSFYYLDESNK